MHFLKEATLVLAACIEGAGAIVIGLAAVEAFLRALLLFVPGRHLGGETDAKEAVRLRLGRWLAVALELELGPISWGPPSRPPGTTGVHQEGAALVVDPPDPVGGSADILPSDLANIVGAVAARFKMDDANARWFHVHLR